MVEDKTGNDTKVRVHGLIWATNIYSLKKKTSLMQNRYKEQIDVTEYIVLKLEGTGSHLQNGIKVNVNKSRYRPGVAQRVPGS